MRAEGLTHYMNAVKRNDYTKNYHDNVDECEK